MKSLFRGAFAVFVSAVLASSNGFGQTFAPTPKHAATQTPSPETAEIQELTKKIDQQNAKIDMLSQQILKLQTQLSNQRPGVMIGEGAPSTATSTTATATSASTSVSPEAPPQAANGNSHIVAPRDTL